MPRDYAKQSYRSSRDSAPRSAPSGVVWLLFGVLIGLIVAGVFYLKQNSHQIPHGPVLPANVIPNQPSKTTATTATTVASTTSPNPAAAQKLQTQFDFYNVLPSNKVVGPSGEEDTTTPMNSPETTAAATTTPTPNTATATPTAAPSTTTPPTASPTTPTTSSAPTATTSTATPAATAPKNSTPAPVVTATPSTTTAPPATSTGPGQYMVVLGAFKTFSEADQLKAQLSLYGFEVHITAVQKGTATLQRVWVGPFNSQNEAQTSQKQLQDNQIQGRVLKIS